MKEEYQSGLISSASITVNDICVVRLRYSLVLVETRETNRKPFAVA